MKTLRKMEVPILGWLSSFGETLVDIQHRNLVAGNE